jgi:hypothetical protein
MENKVTHKPDEKQKNKKTNLNVKVDDVEKELGGEIIVFTELSKYEAKVYYKADDKYHTVDVLVNLESKEVEYKNKACYGELSDFEDSIFATTDYNKTKKISKYGREKTWSVIFEELRKKEGLNGFFG